MPFSLGFVPSVACISLALLLRAEKHARRTRICLFKMLTSSCFIAFACVMGAPRTPYGRTVLVAQGLCWVGDALLLLPGSGFFLAGLGSFLGGHAGYIMAFVMQMPGGLAALPRGPAGWVVGVLVVLAAVVLKWLMPHVPGPMKFPVAIYVVTISTMVFTAAMCIFAGTTPTGGPAGPWLALAGAELFYLSDLCVARERFVRPSIVHAYLGLPLYYVGQMLIAASVR